MVFITSLIFVLITIIASSIFMFVDECHPRMGDEGCPMIALCVGGLCKNLGLRYTMLLITVMITLFFGFPSGMLFYVHVSNYMAGKTTNERFAKNRGARDDISETTIAISEEMLEAQEVKKKRGSCYNCSRMCFDREIISQKDLLQMHLDTDYNHSSSNASIQNEDD